MTIFETLSNAKGAIVAVAAIGGATLGLDNRHTHQSEFEAHMESDRVRVILDLVNKSHEEGSSGWLCRAIEAEFIELCTKNKDHYLCIDPDAKRELMAKAGCGGT